MSREQQGIVIGRLMDGRITAYAAGPKADQMKQRRGEQSRLFTFKDFADVSFSVQAANNVNAVFLHSVITPNSFKSSRPRAKILKSRMGRRISRTHMRILA